VSDDSKKLEPLLPDGVRLLIVDGPVPASGNDWYHCRVAAADLVATSTVGCITWRVYAPTLIVAGLLLAVGTLLLVLLVVFPLLSSPEGGRRVFFQSAFPLFAAALAPLTLALFARLLEARSLGAKPKAGPEPAEETVADEGQADRPAVDPRDNSARCTSYVHLNCSGQEFTFQARLGAPEAQCGARPDWGIDPAWFDRCRSDGSYLLPVEA